MKIREMVEKLRFTIVWHTINGGVDSSSLGIK